MMSSKKLGGMRRSVVLAIIFATVMVTALLITVVSMANSRASASVPPPLSDPNLPTQLDVRGGTPRGLDAVQPNAVELKAIASLTSLLTAAGGDLTIRYNGLTATPMYLANRGGYLTSPSNAVPEQIARDFIRQWRELFRFNENDLNSLKLISRATTAEGITVMLFQQRADGAPVYHGEVLVNVNKAGQIMSVGGDSFPRLNITNSLALSAAQAVTAAAASMNITGFTPSSLGTAQILATFGDLAPEYTTGQKFAKGVFGDEISVETIVFPLGDTGRLAYKFNLTTPQFHGIVWQNIVDAQDGTILKRTSLTSYFGPGGGGNSIPRFGTFRADVQNMVEANNAAGTAQGKVFDTNPIGLSRVAGTGRAVRTGSSPADYMLSRPTYDAEATLTNTWRYSLLLARHQVPLTFLDPSQPESPLPLTPGLLGQVVRGFPDATNPNASSPFGWFYLPTGAGGSEITTANSTTATTRTAGYTMAAEAQSRNAATAPANSPVGNGSQPFTASLTSIPSVTLADGRVLTSVFQSQYTEGNNVTVSDDHENDNDATRGVRGYSANRQFTAPYYDYYAYYELGGIDASGGGTGSTTPVTYPASASPDVYPDAVNLFYFNNVEHDYLYSIGFTEPFWNFQFDNFGKGGAGGDAIVAEVQDGSGTDNANMSSPAEGSSPRMQMYLFTDTGFRRADGDLDWDVVAHEHYHGVSNRSAAKGGDSCLGTPLVGESGGMGEGWSDSIAASLADDDNEGEYVTGQGDVGIRRSAYTNYRWSYGAINDRVLNVRQLGATPAVPDQYTTGIPFEVHDVGEVWAAALWDMRELMIMKDPNGVFFDGNRRLGTGTAFYIGSRQVQSVDTNHPIDYRSSFADSRSTVGTGYGQQATITASHSIVRPGLLAAENATHPARNGPLATAVVNGAHLADTIVLRGLQLAPCNPTFVDMRDSMLSADREITGGENQAIIWRAFASHGVGVNATSTGKTNGIGQQGSPAAIAEDFTVPADVSACEVQGPLPAPSFALSNTQPNDVTVNITPASGASNYVISRSTSPAGPFTTIATIPSSQTTYDDNDGGAGLVLGQTYYYEVHAARSSDCVGVGTAQSIAITVGAPLSPAPSFAGLSQVADPRTGTSLTLSWSAATSTHPGANIVYDIYRVLNVDNSDGSTLPAKFTPTSSNRIAQGVAGTTFTNQGLILGQQYYYIVQARDTTNTKIDTNNVGNTITRFNAPSTTRLSTTVPFALETFEASGADSRFTPQLTDSSPPNQSAPVFQRVPGVQLSAPSSAEQGTTVNAPLVTTTTMFAPDFDPGNAGQGGPSDFFVTINPTNLTRASFLEFDQRFGAEATFDGAALEVLLGDPTQTVTPSPNNTTTFDLDDYIVQNGYNGALTGTVSGVESSPLMGRRAFTGTEGLTHVRVALGDFAPGGAMNPSSLSVYVRFHMTSDVGTFVDGWYIDNVVINNVLPTLTTAARVNVAGRALTEDGRGIANTAVVLRDSTGKIWSSRTNSFGYFVFTEIPSGQSYLLTASARQLHFDPALVQVNDELTDLVLVGK